jgi:phosphoribosyl-AMP cyclohydrolase
MQLKFDKMNGLVPAIVQDYTNNKILMVAFMDETAWEKTLKSGKAAYYSRSRKKSWIKGEESGNFQIVKEIYVDCDEDTVLLKVEQVGGAACHLGYNSCFFRKLENDELKIVEEKVF